jgi:hypothetical protein
MKTTHYCTLDRIVEVSALKGASINLKKQPEVDNALRLHATAKMLLAIKHKTEEWSFTRPDVRSCIPKDQRANFWTFAIRFCVPPPSLDDTRTIH